MAPSVNLSDDVAELSRCVAQLARLALAGRPLSQVEKAAPAAGLSAEAARAFMRGEILLAPRQSVSLANALMEAERLSRLSYLTVLRQGHAGSDAMSASYQARVPETVALTRGRTEDRVWVRGGPPEATAADVEATLGRLAESWPSWKFEALGVESLSGDKPKLGWSAKHADHGQWYGATSLQLAEKVEAVEAEAERKAAEWKAYQDGRGVAVRPARG